MSFLAKHYRTKAVRPFNRVIKADGTAAWVPGLIERLRTTFFVGFKRPARIRSGGSSKKIGIRVHSQIEKIVKGQKVTRLHSFTKMILAELKRQGLTPVASEVPLLSFDGAYLTHSDLICKKKNSRGVWVVSLKTGYNQAYARKQGMCQNLREIPNCYKTHHQLQLACEVACLKHEYDEHVSGAIVLYAGFGKDKRVKIDMLERWNYAKIHQALLRSAEAAGLPLPSTFGLKEKRKPKETIDLTQGDDGVAVA